MGRAPEAARPDLEGDERACQDVAARAGVPPVYALTRFDVAVSAARNVSVGHDAVLCRNGTLKVIVGLAKS
jgi:hypothetical protein